MENENQTSIYAVWRLDPIVAPSESPQVTNRFNLFVDAQGKRWIASYFADNNMTVEYTLEEALEMARLSPGGIFRIHCTISHGCQSTVRTLVGQFRHASTVTFFINHVEGYNTDKTVLSTEGIEEFQAATSITVCSRYYYHNAFRQQVSLEGIEFCSSLRHLKITGLTVDNLAPLLHMELDTLELIFIRVNDLSMIRAKNLTVDKINLSSVRRAFETPSFSIQSLKVLTDPNTKWEDLIELDDIQVELRKHLTVSTSTPILTHQDLINRLAYGQVIYKTCGRNKILDEMKLAIVRRIILKSSTKKLNDVDEPCLEILSKLSAIDDPPKWSFRELLALWRLLELDDNELF